jgi:hypothetical protein
MFVLGIKLFKTERKCPKRAKKTGVRKFSARFSQNAGEAH